MKGTAAGNIMMGKDFRHTEKKPETCNLASIFYYVSSCEEFFNEAVLCTLLS